MTKFIVCVEVFSYLFLSVTLITIILFLSVGSFWTYMLSILLNLLCGYLIKETLDAYNDTFEFKMKSSIIISSLALPLLLFFLSAINTITDALSGSLVSATGIEEAQSFFGTLQANLWILSFLILISFNFFHIKDLFKGGKFLKCFLYLIPLILMYLCVILGRHTVQLFLPN